MKTLEEMTEKEIERLMVLVDHIAQSIVIDERSNDELVALATGYWGELDLDNPLSALLLVLIERLEEKNMTDNPAVDAKERGQIAKQLESYGRNLKELENALDVLRTKLESILYFTEQRGEAEEPQSDLCILASDLRDRNIRLYRNIERICDINDAIEL